MSTPIPSVLTARQRAREYLLADGISLLVAGTALILLGSQDFIVHKFAMFGFLGEVLAILGTLAIYLLLVAKNATITETFKRNFVYPRTGFVSQREEPQNKHPTERELFHLALGITFVGGSWFVAMAYPFYGRWLWPGVLLLQLVFFMRMAQSNKPGGLQLVLALFPLFVGFAWLTFYRPLPPLSLVSIVTGISSAISGLIRMAIYFVRNPRPPVATP